MYYAFFRSTYYVPKCLLTRNFYDATNSNVYKIQLPTYGFVFYVFYNVGSYTDKFLHYLSRCLSSPFPLATPQFTVCAFARHIYVPPMYIYVFNNRLIIRHNDITFRLSMTTSFSTCQSSRLCRENSMQMHTYDFPTHGQTISTRTCVHYHDTYV